MRKPHVDVIRSDKSQKSARNYPLNAKITIRTYTFYSFIMLTEPQCLRNGKKGIPKKYRK